MMIGLEGCHFADKPAACMKKTNLFVPRKCQHPHPGTGTRMFSYLILFLPGVQPAPFLMQNPVCKEDVVKAYRAKSTQNA